MIGSTLFCCLVFFAFWFPFTYSKVCHPFRLAKCHIDIPFHPEWETAPPEDFPRLLSLLQQPFSYLAKGSQSYVFLSEDQTTVLKLFRFDTCPIDYGQKIRRAFQALYGKHKHFTSNEEKVEKNFGSCKLAYDLARLQTGICYLHLNPTSAPLPILKLKDRMGKTHLLDPGKYRFILQKKALGFQEAFREKGAELCTSALLQLFEELATLNLANLDCKLTQNFGFLEQRAVLFDVGNFCYHPDLAKEKKLQFQARLENWKSRHGSFFSMAIGEKN